MIDSWWIEWFVVVSQWMMLVVVVHRFGTCYVVNWELRIAGCSRFCYY